MTQQKISNQQQALKSILKVVGDTYRTFLGDDGRPYMMKLDGTRLPEPITASAILRFVSSLADGHTNPVPAARDAAALLQAKAYGKEPENLNLRVARFSDGLVLDLGQPKSSRCVVITADGWSIEDTAPEGVLFRRSKVTQPLPDPEKGGTLDGLRDLLDLSDQQWTLVKGWLVASLLPDIPRPMLAFLGSQGSAKTTRAAMICGVYDPKPEHSLGSSFGKSLTDDRVKALSHYLVGYDNLSHTSKDASDHLARMVTGDSADARQLYTDGDLYTITYRRTGVFTAIALPPIQPDARERIVPIILERVPENKRKAEKALWREYEALLPRTLGAILDLAVVMLANLPVTEEKVQPLPRMADYFVALQAIDPAMADAYWSAVKDSMRDAAEEDPFVSVVVEWLQSEWLMAGDSIDVTPSQAWQDAGVFYTKHDAGNRGHGTAWWPSSASAFSKAIVRASEPLRALGVEAREVRIKGRRLWRFTQVAG